MQTCAPPSSTAVYQVLYCLSLAWRSCYLLYFLFNERIYVMFSPQRHVFSTKIRDVDRSKMHSWIHFVTGPRNIIPGIFAIDTWYVPCPPRVFVV